MKLVDRFKNMMRTFLLSDPDSVYSSLSSALTESAQERRQRYLLNWAYYLNRQYDAAIQAAVDAKSAHRAQEVLYRKIKPLFNICTAAADLDAAAILPQPVKVIIDNPRGQEVVDRMWRRSRLDAGLSRTLLWGSAMGDAFLRLANEFELPETVIEAPTNFDVVYNPQDKTDILSAESSYNYTDPYDDREYTYSLIVTPESYSTYRNGRAYAYAGNPADATGPLNSWPNGLGFVPVAHYKPLDSGGDYGLSTFFNVLTQLDAANEIASYMAEIIRVHAKPQMVAKWIKKGDLSKGDSDKGEDNIWYLEGNAAMAQMGIQPEVSLLEWSGGDLGGINTFIDGLRESIEQQLPEWHLKRVRDQASPSGYSVALQLTEFNLKMARMERAAKAALSEINCMAMVAQGVVPDMDAAREIEQTYDLGNVLPSDEKGDAELATIDLANNAITRLEYLIRRGYDEKDAKRLLREVDAEKEANMARATALFDPSPDDDDDTEEGEPEPLGA